MTLVTNLTLIASALSVMALPETNLMPFADSLFSEKDYYRAITEYKRVIHNHPDGERRENAQYMIGLAYFRGSKWDAASASFRRLSTTSTIPALSRRAQLMMGESAYRKADYATALYSFETVVSQHPNETQSIDAGMRIAQCYLKLQDEKLAVVQASQLVTQYPHSERIAKLHSAMQKRDMISAKSPMTAGVLSALLPGAGQLYAKRPRDAGISFLLNSGLIMAAAVAFKNDEPVAGGIITAVELTWYMGNIYGAVNATHKYNRTQRENFIEKLDFQCGIMKDADNRIIPTATISLSF